MSDYLEAAEAALAYVAALRVPGEGRWRRSDDAKAPADRTLYYGAAGILIALLEHHALRDGEADAVDRRAGDASLAAAIAAGDELLAWLAQRLAAGSTEHLSVSPATGWPGYAFALQELARVTGRADFRVAAKACLTRLRDAARPLGSGIGWIEPMPFSDITGFKGEREIFDQSVGAAGAGLVLLYAHKCGLHDEALGWAAAVGERLLEVAEADPAGLRWKLMADMPFPFTAPNFAHGGAGVAYFLAQLYAARGDARFLDAAIAGARYVLDRGTPIGADGMLICHTEEAREPLFYLGACHGPAGTGRLLMLLYELTADAQWLLAAERLLRGIDGLGAPEQRSKGFWNNHGQCCGDAGVGDFALLMWRKTGNRAHLELARRCADVLLAVSSVADAAGAREQRCWRHAEHRDRPNFVQAQTGYMQGAAGIASFLMHLHSCLAGAPSKIAWPDWQFDAVSGVAIAVR